MYSLLIYVNNPFIPEMPDCIELLGYRGHAELTDSDEMNRHKGEILVVKGADHDLRNWLSGVTLYVADDPSCQSWSKVTIPQVLKH